MHVLVILSIFFVIIELCGFIADYIIPHINPLNRFINGLPMMTENDETIYEGETT